MKKEALGKPPLKQILRWFEFSFKIMLTTTTLHLGHPIFVQKMFLKTGTIGERDREIRPFGSATGAPMAFLVLLFLS